LASNDEPDDDFDPLDEALSETFPASDPIAISEPSAWPRRRETDARPGSS
jgi:hypothetical protein